MLCFYNGYGFWKDSFDSFFGGQTFTNEVDYQLAYDSTVSFCLTRPRAVFKLDADAIRELKYTGKADVSHLLAADHPDAAKPHTGVKTDTFKITNVFGSLQYIVITKADLLPETPLDNEAPQQFKQQESPAIIQPDDLTESREKTLLRQIGGLALVLAEKHKTYKNGDSVSASAIADAVGLIIDELEEKNRHGLSSSSLRGSIKKGLELIKN